ncbi:MAG: cysteine hydrolase [Armatimonadetes bacterium]|nr:cysteine hydrolase [Armatimonadota bacterium]
MTAPDTLIRTSSRFLEYLAEWEAGLADRPLEEVVRQAGGPECVALHAVDVTVGFCDAGRLASPRIAAIVPPVVALFERAHELGIPHFVLPQDAHLPDSPEFEEYGPHCIEGSREAQTVPELQALPFADRFVNVPKRSISTAIATDLEAWLVRHPRVTRHVVVGDCTDICVYQHAMHLKMRANALGIAAVEVLVPEDCVQTYDLPVDTARRAGVMPHDGDLLHQVFLYHMALNGVQVVRSLY